jgi:hypothetical protein
MKATACGQYIWFLWYYAWKSKIPIFAYNIHNIQCRLNAWTRGVVARGPTSIKKTMLIPVCCVQHVFFFNTDFVTISRHHSSKSLLCSCRICTTKYHLRF